MNASNYLENLVLANYINALSTAYVALFTAAPSDAGGGTEVAGNGYARVQHDFDSGTSWDVTADVMSNIGNITFPQATGGNWGTITHFAIFDASAAGNLLFWGALAASKVVNENDIFQFLDGDLTITCD